MFRSRNTIHAALRSSPRLLNTQTRPRISAFLHPRQHGLSTPSQRASSNSSSRPKAPQECKGLLGGAIIFGLMGIYFSPRGQTRDSTWVNLLIFKWIDMPTVGYPDQVFRHPDNNDRDIRSEMQLCMSGEQILALACRIRFVPNLTGVMNHYDRLYEGLHILGTATKGGKKVSLKTYLHLHFTSQVACNPAVLSAEDISLLNMLRDYIRRTLAVAFANSALSALRTERYTDWNKKDKFVPALAVPSTVLSLLDEAVTLRTGYTLLRPSSLPWFSEQDRILLKGFTKELKSHHYPGTWLTGTNGRISEFLHI